MKEEDKKLDCKIKMIERLIEADKDETACFVRTFVKHTGYGEELIKDILQELKKIGMVEVDYCVNDDGMLNGRGYVLTARATQWSIREWLLELKKI